MGALFSYVDLEARVRPDHPLRTIRLLVNEALAALEGEFGSLYSGMGRPSIAPEKLLRAMLLQAFFSIRSERQLMERLEFDLLFRWFVGLGIDDAVWDHSTFSKNRDRLLEGDIAAKFLSAVLAQPRVKRLLSSEHFSVDGTLIEAWASIKSVRPKDGPDDPPSSGGGRNRDADFHGQKRSNATHASSTDPEARIYKKGPGKEAKLSLRDAVTPLHRQHPRYFLGMLSRGQRVGLKNGLLWAGRGRRRRFTALRLSVRSNCSRSTRIVSITETSGAINAWASSLSISLIHFFIWKPSASVTARSMWWVCGALAAFSFARRRACRSRSFFRFSVMLCFSAIAISFRWLPIITHVMKGTSTNYSGKNKKELEAYKNLVNTGSSPFAAEVERITAT